MFLLKKDKSDVIIIHLQNTEDGHPDKEDIVIAISSMTDVAQAINEYKRRKDLGKHNF